MEKSAPETESAKGRVPGKAMGHASVIQGPQEKPAVNVLTVIFCRTRQGILNKLETKLSIILEQVILRSTVFLLTFLKIPQFNNVGGILKEKSADRRI